METNSRAAEALTALAAELATRYPGTRYSIEDMSGEAPARFTDSAHEAFEATRALAAEGGSRARVCAWGMCVVSFKGAALLHMTNVDYIERFREHWNC